LTLSTRPSLTNWLNSENEISFLGLAESSMIGLKKLKPLKKATNKAGIVSRAGCYHFWVYENLFYSL
jgi:hypothetical protein